MKENYDENEFYVKENVDTRVSQKLIKFSADIIVSRDNIASIKKFRKTKLEDRYSKNSYMSHFFDNPPFYLRLLKNIILLFSFILFVPIVFGVLGNSKLYIYLSENILSKFPESFNLFYESITKLVIGEDLIFSIIFFVIYISIIGAIYLVLLFIIGLIADILFGPHSTSTYKTRVVVGWYISISLNSGEVVLKKLYSENYMEDYIDQLSKSIEAKIDASTYYVINDSGGVIQNVGDNATIGK